MKLNANGVSSFSHEGVVCAANPDGTIDVPDRLIELALSHGCGFAGSPPVGASASVPDAVAGMSFYQLADFLSARGLRPDEDGALVARMRALVIEHWNMVPVDQQGSPIEEPNKIADAAISNAKIDNLSVDSIQIKDTAATEQPADIDAMKRAELLASLKALDVDVPKKPKPKDGALRDMLRAALAEKQKQGEGAGE